MEKAKIKCGECGKVHNIEAPEGMEVPVLWQCDCGQVFDIRGTAEKQEPARPVFLVKAQMLSGMYYEDMQPATNTVDAFAKWLREREQLSKDQIQSIEIKLFEL